MIKPRTFFTYDDLVNTIGEEAIVRRYINNFEKINVSFRLRNKSSDKRASCRIFESSGRLRIIDFGSNEFKGRSKSIFQFLMNEFNLNESQTKLMIYSDFALNRVNKVSFSGESTKKSTTEYKTTIKVRYRRWNLDDKKYWYDKYGLSVVDLEPDIKPIEYFWLTSRRCNNKMFRADKLAYSYDYYYAEDGRFLRKIYQPYSESMKWLSNADLTVVQNYPSLPSSGELIILQSSLKDAKVMVKNNYNSIASISESTWFDDEFWEKIKQRFTRQIYFANNDYDKKVNEGLLYGEKISKNYSIPYIYIPSKYECSDISDFRNKYGESDTKKILKELIK